MQVFIPFVLWFLLFVAFLGPAIGLPLAAAAAPASQSWLQDMLTAWRGLDSMQFQGGRGHHPMALDFNCRVPLALLLGDARGTFWFSRVSNFKP